MVHWCPPPTIGLPRLPLRLAGPCGPAGASPSWCMKSHNIVQDTTRTTLERLSGLKSSYCCTFIVTLPVRVCSRNSSHRFLPLFHSSWHGGHTSKWWTIFTMTSHLLSDRILVWGYVSSSLVHLCMYQCTQENNHIFLYLEQWKHYPRCHSGTYRKDGSFVRYSVVTWSVID